MKRSVAVALAATLFLPAPALADLTPATILTGNVGLSVDGVGSNNADVGNIQASIPVGAVIERAFLYSAGTPYPWYSNSPTTLADYNNAGITLAGMAVNNFDTLVGAVSTRADIGRFYTGRADVTSIIASLVSGSATPDFSFAVTEGTLNNRIDGEVLAIAYSLPSLPEASVVFLDGGQATGGENTTVNFTTPLGDTTAPGFAAELGLGISFSCCNQRSSVTVNGTQITDYAGNYDDGAAQRDGSLITVGGLGDTPLASAGSYAGDHELYNLAPYLSQGDTSFNIFTRNATNDDNIFFGSLYVTGVVGSVTPGVPEMSTWLLMLSGFGLVGSALRRRRRTQMAFG